MVYRREFFWANFYSLQNQLVSLNDTGNKSCNYLTIITSDTLYRGLGNVMFFYASMYGIAKMNRKLPFIHGSTFPLNDIFQITTPVGKFLDVTLFYKLTESSCCKYMNGSDVLKCEESYILGGYRISWKYFQNYLLEIRKQFTFNENLNQKCFAFFTDTTNNVSHESNNTIFIGAHMRRGDFVFETSQSGGYVPASVEYYHKSIKFYENMFQNSSIKLLFLILGNDYEWNLNHAPNQTNVIVVKPSDKPALDMCLLTKCNHSIISTGTFSWWVGFLTGGIVTYMKNQCRPMSGLCKQFEMNDYINLEWTWIPL